MIQFIDSFKQRVRAGDTTVTVKAPLHINDPQVSVKVNGTTVTATSTVIGATDVTVIIAIADAAVSAGETGTIEVIQDITVDTIIDIKDFGGSVSHNLAVDTVLTIRRKHNEGALALRGTFLGTSVIVYGYNDSDTDDTSYPGTGIKVTLYSNDNMSYDSKAIVIDAPWKFIQIKCLVGSVKVNYAE